MVGETDTPSYAITSMEVVERKADGITTNLKQSPHGTGGQEKMAEYVELIDKYLVTRDESGTPSYSWTDNTGEIVRCQYCTLWDEADSYGWIRLGNYYCKCKEFSMERPDEKFVKHYTAPNDYCSHGVKRGDAE